MAAAAVATKAPLGFDPDLITAKYEEEKAKRMKKDGDKQYLALEGAFAHLGIDALSKRQKRAPIEKSVGVLVIGGGFGGVLAAVRCIQNGFEDVLIAEKGAALGGTWYWNQYPGARCDVESYVYMPLLEELGYIPTEKYATGNEIRSQFAKIAEKYNLKDKTLLETVVQEAVWNEKKSHWDVRTDNQDLIHARFVVTATGILHTPKLPGIPGINDFKGKAFHTTRWDYDYTGGESDWVLDGLRDKRVAIIGTGATSIQVVPAVAPYAKKFYVIQRTPASVNVRNNHPTDPEFAKSLKPGWQAHRQTNFNNHVAGQAAEEDLVQDGWTQNKFYAPGTDIEAGMDPMEAMRISDIKKMESIRKRVDDTVKDKEVAEKLKPWYGSICKRPCFHDEYLKAFNLPSTVLVDTDGKGIERITEKGFVVNGKEYEVDLIIYSTGFVSPAACYKYTGMKIVGRNGKVLSDVWEKEGLSTLYGSMSRGFPNYFNSGVLQSGVGVNFVFTLDVHAKHIGYVVAECDKQGIKVVEPEEQAENEWVNGVVQGTKVMGALFASCTPSYYNNEGNLGSVSERSGSFPGGATAWAQIMKDWREAGGMKGLEITVAGA